MSSRFIFKSCLWIAASTLVSASVFAGTHTYSVFESDISGYDSDGGVRTQFNLEPQTGKAWVTSTVFTRAAVGDSARRCRQATAFVKSYVDGLSYDAESSQIVHQAGDVKTVCANVIQKRGIFGGKLLIQMTHHCSLNNEIELQEDKTNQYLRMKKMLKVTLDVTAE